MTNTRSLLTLGLLALMPQIAVTEPLEWKQITQLTGREAEAVGIAVREFQKHKGTKTDTGEPVYGDLKHYTVSVKRREAVVEIGFAPELGPKDKRHPVAGGRTQYGIETYYEISLETLKVLRQTFAR